MAFKTRLRPRVGPSRARILTASALIASWAALALVAGAHAGLQGRADSARLKLGETRRQAGVLTQTIARYSGQISGLEGRVAALRNRQAAVQRRLDAKQEQLDRAAARLAVQQRHLQVLRAHLSRALVALKQRLVAIYESGSPDILTVILDSKGWDDLVTRTQYLNLIQDQGQAVAFRVRDLRDQTQAVVAQLRDLRDRIRAARYTIAAQKEQIVRTRDALQSRQSQLVAARGRRQSALAEVRSHERVLEGDLSHLQAQIQQQLGASSSGIPAGPPAPGSVSSSGLIWPVNGTLTSTFGMRWGRMHEGIDIAAPTGTPILAAQSGTVSLAAYTGGYGNYTCIDHGGGLSTCYGHQSAFATSAGASVRRGQLIGYVGSTGESTGPHLHFEVRVGGIAQDPLGYL